MGDVLAILLDCHRRFHRSSPIDRRGKCGANDNAGCVKQSETLVVVSVFRL